MSKREREREELNSFPLFPFPSLNLSLGANSISLCSINPRCRSLPLSPPGLALGHPKRVEEKEEDGVFFSILPCCCCCCCRCYCHALYVNVRLPLGNGCRDQPTQRNFFYLDRSSRANESAPAENTITGGLAFLLCLCGGVCVWGGGWDGEKKEGEGGVSPRPQDG